MANLVNNRYDIMLIFDVKDGNPNGNPDAGNLPRVDPETGKGLVTDVCIKRKIRNYIQLVKGGEKGFDIFVKEQAILNKSIDNAYADCGIDLTVPPQNPDDGKTRKKKGKGQGSEIIQVRDVMCRNYYDVRTFGAVMTTGANAGQVRGPVQFTFARSKDSIVFLEHSITRCAVTTEEDSDKQGGDNRTMGRKSTVSYGLYIAYGFFSPAFAKQTNFNSDDLQLLWDALVNMFEYDHSATRGMMSTCKLILFKHASALGNAPSGRLFKLVDVKRKDNDKPARSFDDYTVKIDRDNLPQGVEIIELV